MKQTNLLERLVPVLTLLLIGSHLGLEAGYLVLEWHRRATTVQG